MCLQSKAPYAFLERRLARQGRTLIENPEADGGRECPPAEPPAESISACYVDWPNPLAGTELKNWTKYAVRVLASHDMVAVIEKCDKRWAFRLTISVEDSPLCGQEYYSREELLEALETGLAERGFDLTTELIEGKAAEADNKADTESKVSIKSADAKFEAGEYAEAKRQYILLANRGGRGFLAIAERDHVERQIKECGRAQYDRMPGVDRTSRPQPPAPAEARLF